MSSRRPRTRGPPAQLVRSSLRRRDLRGAHLLLAARDRGGRDHRAPAAQHRPAHLRGRSPHGVPARDLRVRALRASRASSSGPSCTASPSTTPSSRASATCASTRWRRTFRPSLSPARARALRSLDRDELERLPRAHGAADAGDAAAALRAVAAAGAQVGRLRAQRRARGGEEGDRDGPLRDSDRLSHGDGLHGLGSRAAPPAAHGQGRRRARRGRRRRRAHGRRGVADRSVLLRAGGRTRARGAGREPAFGGGRRRRRRRRGLRQVPRRPHGAARRPRPALAAGDRGRGAPRARTPRSLRRRGARAGRSIPRRTPIGSRRSTSRRTRR